MRLAILVVYMVSPENEKLLDLHLEYIEKYTSDYTIYGTANKLLPRFQEKLVAHPRVKICSFPPIDVQGAKEHSYYLERLAAAAIEDGADHLLTLHVDSFPVEAGWAEKLAAAVSGQCVLATLSKKGIPMKPTACLFFTREFYLNYQPAFLLTAAEMESDLFRSFVQKYPIFDVDSGMGYIFKAYSAGLRWHGLERINKAGGCAVYGDMLFHLEGVFNVETKRAADADQGSPAYLKLLNNIKYNLLPFLPRRFLHYKRSFMGRILYNMNQKVLVSPLMGEEKGQLFADPEAFLSGLKGNGARQREV